MNNSITAVPGVEAGHWTDEVHHTGVTVVITPDGARGAVFVPGSAPGTRELALLSPRHLSRSIHAICLSGGSAFGLAAADGVMAALAERGVGFPTAAGGPIPLVPAAILFDLHTATRKPTAAGGRAAVDAALEKPGPLASGRVGAGAGAMVGGMWGTPHRGGIGGAAAEVADWTVGVTVALNAAGTVRDPETGAWRTGPPVPRGTPSLGEATTLAVVATDAPLDKGQLQTVARMAAAGMARAIYPAFTPFDGDIVFALSTGDGAADDPTLVAAVGNAAAYLLGQAVLRAVGPPVVTMHPIARAELPGVARFVGRLNVDPAHNICYFGDSEAEILTYLGGLEPTPEAGFYAMAGDHIVGVMAVEYDLEIGRCWLHGPLVDGADWEATAAALHAAAVDSLPEGIVELEVGIDSRNTRVADFMTARGYAPMDVSLLLMRSLEPAPAVSDDVVVFDPAVHDEAAVADLHDRIFPDAYYTGRKLVEKSQEDCRLLLTLRDGAAVGYLFLQLKHDDSEGYIDFIGVEEAARSQGVGRGLLAAAVAHTRTHPGLEKVALTVKATNAPALAMYDAAGFERVKALTGLRRAV